jgi:hypothetical protein
MASPQGSFQLGMPQEKPARSIPFHDFHHIRDPELGFTVQEKVNMIRHHLHSQDPKRILGGNLLQHFFEFFLDSILQDPFPVFCAPDNMIL